MLNCAKQKKICTLNRDEVLFTPLPHSLLVSLEGLDTVFVVVVVCYTRFTLFRIALGDFNVGQMTKTNPVLGPVFFVLFVIFVYFVLLCMFLAIINHAYVTVTEIGGQFGQELTLASYLFAVCCSPRFIM